NLTAAITSATPVQRAISAGCRSIEPFQIRRCSSYAGCVAGISSPRSAPSSSATAVSSSLTSAAIAMTGVLPLRPAASYPGPAKITGTTPGGRTRMALQLGDTAPDFEAQTTEG